MQISLDKITQALASFQNASQSTILKERRSYGYWSPRRCDVYVVSHQEGYLHDRVEVTAMLWQNGISADLMYEFGLQMPEHENVIEQCAREGILCVLFSPLNLRRLIHDSHRFIVYPRARTARRDQPAFKVKSILKGTEIEGILLIVPLYYSFLSDDIQTVSRQDLVPFLHQQLAEQKRVDASLSGVPSISEGPSTSSAAPKEASAPAGIHLVLPSDAKKQRKHTKQMFLDRGEYIVTCAKFAQSLTILR